MGLFAPPLPDRAGYINPRTAYLTRESNTGSSTIYVDHPELFSVGDQALLISNGAADSGRVIALFSVNLEQQSLELQSALTGTAPVGMAVTPVAPLFVAHPPQTPTLAVFDAETTAVAVQLVGPVAGQTIYVFSGVVTVSVALAGATIDLQTLAPPPASSVTLLRFSAASTGSVPFSLGGLPIPYASGALRWALSGAVTASIGLAYTQA